VAQKKTGATGFFAWWHYRCWSCALCRPAPDLAESGALKRLKWLDKRHD
jgi:hypothetical protein